MSHIITHMMSNIVTHHMNHYMTDIYVQYVIYDEKTDYENLGAAGPKPAVGGYFAKKIFYKNGYIFVYIHWIIKLTCLYYRECFFTYKIILLILKCEVQKSTQLI